MLDAEKIFSDRREAGRRLASKLSGYTSRKPFVMALSKGGVPVAFEVAKALGAPLDLMLLENDCGPADRRTPAQNRPVAEIGQSCETYLRGQEPIPMETGVVILVDDGTATDGYTKKGLRLLYAASARSIVVAVPLAQHESLDMLRSNADDVLCLAFPKPFRAGRHYAHFDETSDDEVDRLLQEARRGVERR